jgi:GDP-mannose 6-dehydrogenase
MVERLGCKRVGVLGLSFKAGTDDVRESPVVPLVETLLGRGYDVKLHDENVDPAKLIGANRSFVERALPHIASLMSPTVAGVLDHAEVVVIANGSAEYRSVPSRLRDGQTVIDLVGLKNGHHENGHGELRGSYEGICW